MEEDKDGLFKTLDGVADDLDSCKSQVMCTAGIVCLVGEM